jgi:hypothetical protein
MENVNEIIVEYARELCGHSLCVSQEDLSGRLSALGVAITQTGISKVENQDRYVMDYGAEAMAKALRVSVGWFYGSE